MYFSIARVQLRRQRGARDVNNNLLSKTTRSVSNQTIAYSAHGSGLMIY